jgi:hypothetical protein
MVTLVHGLFLLLIIVRSTILTAGQVGKVLPKLVIAIQSSLFGADPIMRSRRLASIWLLKEASADWLSQGLLTGLLFM